MNQPRGKGRNGREINDSGRSGKMIDQSWFGPTIHASLFVILNNRSPEAGLLTLARLPSVSP